MDNDPRGVRLRAIGAALNAILNGDDDGRPLEHGFCVLVFPIDNGFVKAEYISNVVYGVDAARILRQYADHLELTAREGATQH